MPCPHNEISIVQRSHRQSAVAAAAYQSGEKLFCEYDQEGRTEQLDTGGTKPGDFQRLKGSQRSPVLSPEKGTFHRGGFGKLYRNVREICRRLPKADEAKGNPQQRD